MNALDVGVGQTYCMRKTINDFQEGEMKSLLLLVISSVFVLSSCATSRLVGRLPHIGNPDEIAEVYLIRSKSLSAAVRTVTVELNGEKLLQIKKGSYTKFRLPADEYNREHSLKVSMGDSEDHVDLLCQPGEEYYYLIDVGVGKIDLAKIGETQAKNLMRESAFFELKQ